MSKTIARTATARSTMRTQTAETIMLITSKSDTRLDYPLAGTVLLTVIVLSALAYRNDIYTMLPDNFNYITYWQQLFEGSFRTTSLQTPKPLLVMTFGAL